jgi:hypothetical protein
MTFMEDVEQLTAAIIADPPTKKVSDGTVVCYWCNLAENTHLTRCPVWQTRNIRLRGNFDD